MSWDGRIKADSRALPIASESVQCVVTSPPYWGLRDYGNSDQIGIEKTPSEYIDSIRAVFRELWRVLKSDGVVWLNLGDTYAGSWGAMSYAKGEIGHRRFGGDGEEIARPVTSRLSEGLKAKDLIGIPWAVALALRSDGWYLRRDIIWNKPNPMPESVTDRPTSSHEYIFLLTKSERYYYDAASIADNCSWNGESGHKNYRPLAKSGRVDAGMNSGGAKETRNKRSVWTVSTRPYPEAHYATFPEEIPEICIKAGTRVGDLVLDPFFGSGTVGRVAERLSRRWIGCDLAYQDLQAKRLSNLQKELVEQGG